MVPAASDIIPRFRGSFPTPLEAGSTCAYRGVTAYGGPFQGPSASGWFGNFDAIRQDGLRLVQLPHPNRCRLSRDARLGWFPFAPPYLRDGLLFSGYLDGSVLPVASSRAICLAPRGLRIIPAGFPP